MSPLASSGGGVSLFWDVLPGIAIERVLGAICLRQVGNALPNFWAPNRSLVDRGEEIGGGHGNQLAAGRSRLPASVTKRVTLGGDSAWVPTFPCFAEF
ncbi:hypothetical protein [Allorhodopirellula solitaria]|uniref:hypothetical protein n=1 Tax=Allorhodopirellula solitaria TaxID=2527987 RepID=UPI001647B930|nr:hypothetical protein [Allorhodopirellula solitaria]